jgi:predicted secreted protein
MAKDMRKGIDLVEIDRLTAAGRNSRSAVVTPAISAIAACSARPPFVAVLLRISQVLGGALVHRQIDRINSAGIEVNQVQPIDRSRCRVRV